MSTRRAKFAITCLLLLAVTLGIWAGMGIKTLQLANSTHTQRAIRIVRINIEPPRKDELFTQLRKFADKWGYAIRIAPLDPNGEHFSIQMWRSDIKLSDSARVFL